MTDSEFKRVTYKRKGRKLNTNKLHENLISSLSNSETDLNIAERRIIDAKVEISSTDLYASIVASLKEGLSSLNQSLISEIICLGIGKIGECLTARYQFAVLLSLSECFKAKILAYDPIFSDIEKELLSKFDVTVLEENLEGKYRIKDKKSVIFYMPHCSKQLTNNLLWSNWGLDLNYCIIIANSFSKIMDSNTTKEIEVRASYISKVSPYVLELAIINNFKYYEIFNDIAVHVFPKLHLVCEDLWNECSEPKYTGVDLEFITK